MVVVDEEDDRRRKRRRNRSGGLLSTRAAATLRGRVARWCVLCAPAPHSRMCTGGTGATETERPRTRERWRRHVEPPRVRPSRNARGPMYAQRASLTPSPSPTRRTPLQPLHSQQHTTATAFTTPLPPLAEHAGGRRAHTHTRNTRARSKRSLCTGRGTRWQQCVTDRPAHESRSHRPIQLYVCIQDDFRRFLPFISHARNRSTSAPPIQV